MILLSDADLKTIDVKAGAQALKAFLRNDAIGNADAPARFTLPMSADSMIFTAGADQVHFGFRVYSRRKGLDRPREDQAVLCWDRETHDLLAIALGDRLGTWRTGLLGGIARQVYWPDHAVICGVVGTGTQAETQALATAALTPPSAFHVYSRNVDRCRSFCESLQVKTGIPSLPASSTEEVAVSSDILILATTSPTPVIELDWLRSCKHVTTVGPKFKNAYELPMEIADWADLVFTDSPQQIAAFGGDHFLSECLPLKNIKHLGSLLDKRENIPGGRSLYLSAGLAGTEVALLAALIAAKAC